MYRRHVSFQYQRLPFKATEDHLHLPGCKSLRDAISRGEGGGVVGQRASREDKAIASQDTVAFFGAEAKNFA